MAPPSPALLKRQPTTTQQQQQQPLSNIPMPRTSKLTFGFTANQPSTSQSQPTYSSSHHHQPVYQSNLTLNNTNGELFDSLNNVHSRLEANLTKVKFQK
jgi:hypothetical protein